MAERVVRIFRVVMTEDETGLEGNPPTDFWDRMLAAFPTNGHGEFGRHEFVDDSGVLLEGELRTSASGQIDFVYIGRSRDRLDWPDRRTKTDPTLGSLALDESITGIFEPARMKPIPGTNNVAIARSYAGPLPSAAESWLTDAYRTVKKGFSITLVPVTRKDQIARLRAAVGVSRLTVSLEGDIARGQGRIAKAARELQEAVGFPVRTDITLSMGNNKFDVAFDSLKDLLARAMETGSVSKAEATLLEDTPGGEVKRDTVDFFSDKLAYTIEVKSHDVSDAEYSRVLQHGIDTYLADKVKAIDS